MTDDDRDNEIIPKAATSLGRRSKKPEADDQADDLAGARLHAVIAASTASQRGSMVARLRSILPTMQSSTFNETASLLLLAG